MDARGESSQRDIQRAEKRFGREKRKRAFPSVGKEPFDLQKYVEERERNVVVHRGVAMRVEQKPTRASDEAPLIVSEQWADAEKVEWALPLDDRTTGAGEPSSTLGLDGRATEEPPGALLADDQPLRWSDCCEEGPLDFSTKSRKKALTAPDQEEEAPWEAVRDKKRRATKQARKLTNSKLLSFTDDE